MKQTIIKGICFLALLSGLLVLTNAIYVRWFFRQDIIEADATQLFRLDSLEDISDVLYFGESSNATYSPHDTCPLAISEILQRECPQVKIGTMDHGAYHAKLYLDLIKNITPGSRVKTIIVTMNLRSFGTVWINSALETPLMKTDVMYKKYPPIIRRLMLAFGAFDNTSPEDRNEIMLKHFKDDKLPVIPGFRFTNIKDWDRDRCYSPQDTFPDGKLNGPQKDIACQYIKVHGFLIDTLTNPRIRDFDEIVKVASEKHLNLVFNLMAENMDYADSLVGYPLPQLMEANRKLLVKRYNRNGVIVVDNIHLVDGNNFLEPYVVTEHYNQVGRIAIAKNVAKTAAKYLVK
jgi:hypothetical protein